MADRTVCGMWHPWRTAAERYPHITIVTEHPLPRGVAGLIKDTTIWLCSTLTQAERRSVLTHELQHLERGIPAPEYLAREERLVDELAARQLIPLPKLIEVLHWTRDPYEIADELWTDAHTVRVRLNTLDPIEVTELEHALEGDWLWIP